MIKEDLNLVNKTFYLTSLFANMSADKAWYTFDSKVGYILLSKISEYRIYIPDLNKDENIRKKEFKELVNNVPIKYNLTREEIINITGTEASNFSRDIKKCIDSLLSKRITMPHPLEFDNKNSYISSNWFTDIEYLDRKGEVVVHFNKNAIEKIVAIAGYTKMILLHIKNLSNQNSISSYTMFKILIDSSNKRKLSIAIDDYKNKLGISEKYKINKHFKDKVLEIVKLEINKGTDLVIDYELRKGEIGRGNKYIDFTFNYKPQPINKKKKSSIKNTLPSSIENKETDDLGSPFEQILISWNIRAKKVVEIEESYSLDVIQSAIDKTLEKEKAGEIKTTKSAIFFGILENKQLASDEVFEREQQALIRQQEKELRAKISAEYDMLNSFISSNEDIIKSALTVNNKHLPITDKDAIPVFKKIKSIDADKFRGYKNSLVSFYHFEGNTTVSSSLSDIVDRSKYIEIEEYKDDMEIIQAYKEALINIKANKYITDDQKDVLRKEVQDTINILLGL